MLLGWRERTRSKLNTLVLAMRDGGNGGDEKTDDGGGNRQDIGELES